MDWGEFIQEHPEVPVAGGLIAARSIKERTDSINRELSNLRRENEGLRKQAEEVNRALKQQAAEAAARKSAAERLKNARKQLHQIRVQLQEQLESQASFARYLSLIELKESWVQARMKPDTFEDLSEMAACTQTGSEITRAYEEAGVSFAEKLKRIDILRSEVEKMRSYLVQGRTAAKAAGKLASGEAQHRKRRAELETSLEKAKRELGDFQKAASIKHEPYSEPLSVMLRAEDARFVPVQKAARLAAVVLSAAAIALPLILWNALAEFRASRLLEAGTVDFGDVAVGETKPASLVLQNRGKLPITFKSLVATSIFSAEIQGPVAIPVGKQVQIPVYFKPSQTRRYTEALMIESDATSGSEKVTLEGNGVTTLAVAELSISPRHGSFGEVAVGETSMGLLVLHNKGGSPLRVRGITATPACFLASSQAGEIAPGESMDFVIGFSPQAGGQTEGTLVVDADVASGDLTLRVSGTGVARSHGLSMPKSIDLGPARVGGEAEAYLSVTNIGTVSASLQPSSLSGDFLIEPPQAGPHAGDAAQVRVLFRPFKTGRQAGVVEFVENAEAKTYSIAAQGIGIAVDMVPVRSNEKSNSEFAPFYIQSTEVSREQWNRVVRAATHLGYDLALVECSDTNKDLPVAGISWFDALKWANARSEVEGFEPVYLAGSGAFRSGRIVPQVNPQSKGYRLPTLAEWQWAAMGGDLSINTHYSGSDDITLVGNTSDFCVGEGQPQSVGAMKPNELGIFDMSGNVAEWVWTDSPRRDAQRALAGGSFAAPSNDAKVDSFFWSSPEAGRPDSGLRVLIDL